MGELDLDLGRKAAYRRVLAVLKSRRLPFVVVGAFAESLHLGVPVDGNLAVFLHDEDAVAALHALVGAGFKVEEDPGAGRAAVGYGGHTVELAWRLPEPLGGAVDEAWFEHASRRSFLDLRVRLAPPEELLWMRLAAHADLAGEGAIDGMLERFAAQLDWARLLARLAGQEALLLAHLFLFVHRHPDTARRAIPPSVIPLLLSRLGQPAVPQRPRAR